MSASARRPGVVASAAIALIKIYRVSLSPVLAALGVRCRHLPTCSAYAIDSFSRHGAWIGFWLTLSRLSRCHPLGSSGWDPAPKTASPQGWRFWRHGDWAWTARLADAPDDLQDKA